MSAVTTGKRLDPGDVSTQLGRVALVMETDDGVHTITADVPQADLEAAVAAAPDLDVEQANALTLHDRAEQALGVNRTYLARTSPTNAQNAAQLQALTRQNNGIIRLLLNRLDGTD